MIKQLNSRTVFIYNLGVRISIKGIDFVGLQLTQSVLSQLNYLIVLL